MSYEIYAQSFIDRFDMDMRDGRQSVYEYVIQHQELIKKWALVIDLLEDEVFRSHEIIAKLTKEIKDMEKTTW